jgi:hypothetical protein
MRAAGKQTLKRARELSPTVTGESDKSGFVVIDDLTAQIGFRSIVSRLQHENLEWKHPDGGQPKFLETAADEIDIAAIAAEAIRRELSG